MAFAEPSQAAKNRTLFNAAKNGTAADIRAAIKAGADVNDRNWERPLVCAAMYSTNSDVIKLLLAVGAYDEDDREYALTFLGCRVSLYGPSALNDAYRKMMELLQ